MTPTLWLDLGVGAGGLLALVLLANALHHLRHRRIGRASAHGAGGLLLGAIATFALLVGINLLTYSRFTTEQYVGEIGFVALGQQHYEATLASADGQTFNVVLAGDEWQLDARVIKWKGLGTLLGLPPLYRLERLSGRYQSVAQTRLEPASAVALTKKQGLSLWELAHGYVRWLPLVDASYGSATYLPMADGAQYVISMSNTGLLARPANSAARHAIAGWQ